MPLLFLMTMKKIINNIIHFPFKYRIKRQLNKFNDGQLKLIKEVLNEVIIERSKLNAKRNKN